MSVTMYAVSGVGNDNNGGSSTGASPLANGAGAATTLGVAAVDLSADSPDLSGVSIGDTIRLNARVDGKNVTVPSDIFEITAVDDGADSVDVTPVPDSNTAGVTWAIGGSFATVTRLVTVADQNDLLYMKGTFDESVDMVNTTAPGTQLIFIRLIGYSTTPGDGGMATLDSNDTKANGIIVKNGVGYWSFENIRITRYTNQGFRGAFASEPFRYLNCRCDDINSIGFALSASSQLFINCYAHDCTAKGFEIGENSTLIACVAKDNADGFWAGGQDTYLYCAAIGNTGNGFHMNADLNHKGNLLVNCLIDGDGKKTDIGIRLLQDADNLSTVVMNCLVHDCVTGIEDAISDQGIFAPGLNNMVANCTTPYTRFSGLIDSVTSAPSFVDEASNDYTPTAGSNQEDAGHSLNSQDWIPVTGNGAAIGPIEGVTVVSDYPSEDDVRDGVDYNSAGNTGNMTLPVEADVENGKQYGTSGTEFTGTVTLPSASEVEEAVTYGAGGAEFTGTFVGEIRLPLYPID